MSDNATHAVWLVPGWPGLSSSADAQSLANHPDGQPHAKPSGPDALARTPDNPPAGLASESAAASTSATALIDSCRQTTVNTSVEQALMQHLGFPSVDAGSIPAAVFRYPFDMQRQVPGNTVCADPIHLRAERDHARMVPVTTPDIEMAEAQDLLHSLNSLVGADGLNFECAEPGRWYLTGMPAHALDTWPVHAVAHRNVANFMPGQGEAAEWRRLMTEVQMLMHSHPVNTAREQRGQLSINGIWFWGGAVCPELPACPAVRLFADDYFSQGLAAQIGLRALPLIPGDSVGGMLAEAADISIDAARKAGETLLVVEMSVQDAWLSGDAEAMVRSADRLNRHWLIPFRAALSSARLDQLVVDGCDGVAVHLLAVRGWARFRQLFFRRR